MKLGCVNGRTGLYLAEACGKCPRQERVENDDGLIQVPNKHSLHTHTHTHDEHEHKYNLLTCQERYLLQNTAYYLSAVFMIIIADNLSRFSLIWQLMSRQANALYPLFIHILQFSLSGNQIHIYFNIQHWEINAIESMEHRIHNLIILLQSPFVQTCITYDELAEFWNFYCPHLFIVWRRLTWTFC